MGYSFRLTARVLLYAPSHRQDNTYHGLCYTSRGALAGTRNSSMGPPHRVGDSRWRFFHLQWSWEITFWGFWLVIHLRWPKWRTRPESKGSCWNRNAINYCTKNSDVTCPFHVFNVRTLFYFSDICFLQ